MASGKCGAWDAGVPRDSAPGGEHDEAAVEGPRRGDGRGAGKRAHLAAPSSSSPAARVAASASAANPDALDARPAAVGKLFADSTRARSDVSGQRAHAIEQS